MNAQSPVRGAELLQAGRIGIGPHWLARLAAGGFQRVLDRIDRGLASGRIETTLPDGAIRVLGGRAPGFTAIVTLHSWNALIRLATGGSVGWYQAWEAGEWSSPDPVPLFALFMANAATLGGAARARGPWRLAMRTLHALRRNTHGGAARNVAAHYDLGNDFYGAWLGELRVYSSAMFEDQPAPSRWQQHISPLDFAQLSKISTVIARMKVDHTSRVLEIGCGWGALAAALAGTAASVEAISLSDEQLAYCRRRQELGGQPRDGQPRDGQPREGKPRNTSANLQFRKLDYRDVSGTYDAIASIEMVEALGRAYWPSFLGVVAGALRPGGRAVIQYISIRDDLFDAYAASADFIQTYVFPGGMLIRTSEFRALAEARGLIWHDEFSFGNHYAATLESWRANFDAAVEEGRLPAGFDDKFVRLWRYYLMYCEGGFGGGGIDVSQVTLVKGG